MEGDRDSVRVPAVIVIVQPKRLATEVEKGSASTKRDCRQSKCYCCPDIPNVCSLYEDWLCVVYGRQSL